MRQLTNDEYNLLDDNSLRIHHWVHYDMTPEERKRWDRLGHEEREVMAIEHFEAEREKRREEAKQIVAARPVKKKWFAPDTLTARIEGSDIDAIVEALREKQGD